MEIVLDTGFHRLAFTKKFDCVHAKDDTVGEIGRMRHNPMIFQR